MDSGSDVDTFLAGGSTCKTVPTEEETEETDEESGGALMMEPGRLGREAGSLVSQDLGTNKASKRNQE
jgi:hypothetical protein